MPLQRETKNPATMLSFTSKVHGSDAVHAPHVSGLQLFNKPCPFPVFLTFSPIQVYESDPHLSAQYPELTDSKDEHAIKRGVALSTHAVHVLPPCCTFGHAFASAAVHSHAEVSTVSGKPRK
jgi:hypothetical protein